MDSSKVGESSKAQGSPKDPRVKGRERGVKRSSAAALSDLSSPDLSSKLMASSPSNPRMAQSIRGKEWRLGGKDQKELMRKGVGSKSEDEVKYLGSKKKAKTRSTSGSSGIDLMALNLSSHPVSPKTPAAGLSSTSLGMSKVLANTRREVKEASGKEASDKEAEKESLEKEETAGSSGVQETRARQVWEIEHLRLIEEAALTQRKEMVTFSLIGLGAPREQQIKVKNLKA